MKSTIVDSLFFVVIVIGLLLLGGLLIKDAIRERLSKCEEQGVSLETCVKLSGLK